MPNIDSPALPSEIWTQIISLINDQPTLASLALTSHLLHELSTSRQYETVILSTAPKIHLLRNHVPSEKKALIKHLEITIPIEFFNYDELDAGTERAEQGEGDELANLDSLLLTFQPMPEDRDVNRWSTDLPYIKENLFRWFPAFYPGNGPRHFKVDLDTSISDIEVKPPPLFLDSLNMLSEEVANHIKHWTNTRTICIPVENENVQHLHKMIDILMIPDLQRMWIPNWDPMGELIYANSYTNPKFMETLEEAQSRRKDCESKTKLSWMFAASFEKDLLYNSDRLEEVSEEWEEINKSGPISIELIRDKGWQETRNEWRKMVRSG
ncbi:hypothetical protein I302_108779 [Kwoniella bestiolae CBS 10118]|uniref:F-box domain-containing protein n=1 Tax=Kwoniella bestiolae CBS 10118 TaxID=1296100 RepID=A0A1B9FU35_9TREE|nr:hypothetical protein I302_07916 [Kwoniella bestiolae CBS 10118]OCF22271.1 hypothetical protein I302_07916 [Kwoniella bestiolae CBS 10118]